MKMGISEYNTKPRPEVLMDKPRRTQVMVYGVAVLAIGVSLIVRLALVPWLGYHAELMTFFLAVIISAFLGGAGPGLLATVLGAAAGRYFFIEPRYSLAIHELGRAYAMGLFVLVGAVISGLMESLHRSRLRIAEEEQSRAQQAIREAEQRFEHVAENMREIFWVTDLGNSRVMYVSPGYDQVWGRSTQSLYDQPRSWTDSIHPDDRPGVTENLEQRGHGVFNDLEFRIIRPDGSIRWIRNRAFPIPDAGGNPSRIAGLAEDITQLKLAGEELQRTTQLFQAVVDGTQDAVYVKDRDGRHLMFNAAASRMVGKPIGEVLGRDDTAIWGADDARLVTAHDRGVMESGVPSTDEKTLTSSGVTRTYLASKAPYRDGKGNIIGTIGICHDITERKRIEEALRESEQRWRSLTETLPQLVWTNKPDGSMDYASAQVEQYLGRPQSELLAWGWQEVLHPDDRERVEQAWRAAVAGQSEYEIEHRLRRFDGTYRWFKTRGVAARDGAGHVYKWFGTCTDITDLKQAEQALRDSEERWRSLTEALPQLVWRATPDGANEYFSTQWTQYTGLAEFETVGWGWMQALHPDDREPTRQLWLESVAGHQPYDVEYRVRRHDGEYRWFKTRGVPIRDSAGTIVKWFGTCTDITDLRQTQEALRRANDRVELAVRSSNISIWEQDMPDGRIENAHLTLFNVWEPLGYDPRTIPTDFSSACAVLFSPHDRERVVREIRELLASDRWEWKNEYRVLAKDGSTRWLLARGTVLRDPDGNPVRFIGGSTDITELKRAEEALRESEERFRGTFENAAVGIAHTHPTGRFLRVNETFCKIIGYPREELLQKGFQDITHPDDLAANLNLLAGLIRGDSPGYATEKRYLRKDGSPIWAELVVSLQRDAAGEPAYAIGVIQDISERKQLEGELRQAKDVAEAANRAKDEFLANVSHEIRTPMNAILGMAELTLDTPLTDEQRSNVNIVLSSAEGLLSLINDLLDFSKIEAGRLELEEADFSLRTVLNQTLRALALRAHKKGMELACQVEQDVPDGLVGDGNRLRQVLLNLIGNAIKFTEAGEVIVRVRAPETDHQSVVIDFEIADTGIGIAPENQQTIFRAFEQADSSTTRRYGGTGLGLTISARLVEMMGGGITVESEVNRGSTFRFGARFGRSSRLAAAPAQPPVVDLHGLRVLIVDDNATNRTILHGWASAWGMIPTATADVPAAMSALWRGVASKEPFALVLLDARMPGTDGLELAKGISQTPELSACRIILLTSDDRPGDAKRYRARRISAVLMKPVQQEELLDNIYRVLSHGAVETDNAESIRTTAPDTVRGPAAPSAAERSSRRLNLLVAEDNKFNQQVIQRMLERRGHTVRVVPNGSETLAALEQNAFDLLLLDVNMPEMNGFEVIRTIREREKTSGNHLRVIALTALSGKRDRERCIEAGMDDFLAKPVRAAEVYASLERVIAVHPIAHPDAPAGNFALIDPAIVLSGCAGDAALLADMIQLFEEEAPELLARVEAAVRSSDAEQLRTAAHSLRGLVSSFSTSAANAAQVLEQMGIEGRAGEAAEAYQTLNQAVRDLRAVLPTLTIKKLRDLV